MSFSMYDASAPVFIRALGNLSAILAKGAAHADAKKIDQSVFLTARLSPDMFPLTRQVQIASDTVKNGAGRLAAIDLPSFPDTETSFPELQERLTKTISFVQSITAAQIEDSEARTIALKLRGQEVTFPAPIFLTNFVLPNLYFHVTTAYLILRHNGVALGKPDYLGPMS
jgi:hypothetical protein